MKHAESDSLKFSLMPQLPYTADDKLMGGSVEKLSPEPFSQIQSKFWPGNLLLENSTIGRKFCWVTLHECVQNWGCSFQSLRCEKEFQDDTLE